MRGDLLAFADDMLIMTNALGELKMAISALESLKDKWNLRLNKKKSEILTRVDSTHEVSGVKCVKCVKYLGVKVVLERKEQSRVSTDQIYKNVNMLRSRLKRADPDVL